MNEAFYLNTIQTLVGDGWLDPRSDVLAVAATELDRDVLLAAGLRSVTISNLDKRPRDDAVAPFHWTLQDASDLTFDDDSFDFAICHQGLHHCRSPHRALLEMYRVARRGVVVFEPHDSLLTRVGTCLGIGQRYETAAMHVLGSPSGGVQNSEIPNFVYRWSAREARNTLASYDPIGSPRVRCFYDFRIPARRFERLQNPVTRTIGRLSIPVVRTVLRIAPSQANAVALVIDKLDPRHDLHPWLTETSRGRAELDTGWVRNQYDEVRDDISNLRDTARGRTVI